MTSPFDPQPRGNFTAFPVGTRVTVQTQMQDMHFFRLGEPGQVVRNTGQYLGVIVAFEHPWICDHGHFQHEVETFNFNPVDLAVA